MLKELILWRALWSVFGRRGETRLRAHSPSEAAAFERWMVALRRTGFSFGWRARKGSSAC